MTLKPPWLPLSLRGKENSLGGETTKKDLVLRGPEKPGQRRNSVLCHQSQPCQLGLSASAPLLRVPLLLPQFPVSFSSGLESAHWSRGSLGITGPTYPLLAAFSKLPSPLFCRSPIAGVLTLLMPWTSVVIWGNLWTPYQNNLSESC